MRIPSSVFRSAIVAGLAFVASCGSDSATSPSPSGNLSAAISQTTVGDASSYSSARALTNVPGATAPAFDPSVCTYSSSDNGFTCPSKTASGVNFQLKYFLFNSAGVAMSAYDPATTDRLRTVWDATGTFTTTGATPATVQLNHHSDLTLTGLLGTSRTLNGTSSDHDIVDTGSGASAVHAVVDVSSASTNLALPATSGEFPTSGLLSSDITIASTAGVLSSSNSLRATLAFNGTRFALLTVSTSLGVQACTIDLTGGTAPRC